MDDASLLTIETFSDGTGIEVIDSIERRRVSLGTPERVRPSEADPDTFLIPVDVAVSVVTDEITLGRIVDAYIRDDDGKAVAELRPTTDVELPDGSYHVELNAPIKVHLLVRGSITATARLDRMAFEFEPGTEVLVGARSYHQRPAATITTTADPEDVMTAVSHLGSALKTTTCERSYPTLRGHPPTFQIGEELDVPTELTPPQTGITLELPPTYEAVYTAAPLAYYLGASVVPAATPRVVTTTGFEHRLDADSGFEAEVERVLKQTFFLDCLVRTEGYYRIDLHERHAIESSLDLDITSLYGLSPAQQLEAYLRVPFQSLEDQVPAWALTAHVPPVAEHVEVLPFVVNELAVVRTGTPRRVTPSGVRSAVLGEYAGWEPSGMDQATAGPADQQSVVSVDRTGSIDDAWFGDQTPIQASKASVAAFRNKLARTSNHTSIDITVIGNESEMAEEYGILDEVYGSREELPFDVRLRRDLSVAELRDVLESDIDFLHYVGHIDDGFVCTDGTLDVATLDHVGADAFVLNACRSYAQGVDLIEAGSVGGVVTIDDVVDSGAVRIGGSMARLLNLGFPLRAALKIAREQSVVGGHYIVVGDGSIAVTQVPNGAPILCRIEPADGHFLLTIETHLPVEGGMGSLFYPIFDGNDRHFLIPGRLGPFELSESELQGFLTWHQFPVEFDGSLRWNDTVESIELE